MRGELLSVKCPELFEQLCPIKNTHIDISKLTHSSHKMVYWVCSKGHEWEASPNSRRATRIGDSVKKCPYCVHQRISPEMCLATLYPEVAKMWHKDNKKTAYEVFPFSRTKYMWLCPKGHTWQSSISNVSRNKSCPICSNHLLIRENSFGTLYPDLAKEWSTKNELTPFDYSPKSGKKVWWVCSKNHEWKTSVACRTLQKYGCLHCGRMSAHEKLKIAKINNSLAEKHPILMKEWDWDKNKDIDPYNINRCAKIRVWWKCKKGHSWQTIVGGRTTKYRGCAICNESKGEKRVEEVLENLDIVFTRQKTYKDCKYKKVLPFDFYVEYKETFKDLNFVTEFLIEYDGIQHFKSVKRFGGDAQFEECKLKDAIRNKYCKENNIPLLRIPYTEYNNIEEIIKRFINNIL